MSKTYTWDSSFESSPPDSQSVGLGDDRIRELKVAIRERLETDHYFGSGNSDDEGKHNSIRFREQSSDPSTGATELALYVKDDGGTPELFLRRESDGTEYQATFSGGGIGFPSGTKMLFYQASAPPGWSIDSSFTDGTLPYIDNANGGTAKSGGTWTISGLSASEHTHSISSESDHKHLTLPVYNSSHWDTAGTLYPGGLSGWPYGYSSSGPNMANKVSMYSADSAHSDYFSTYWLYSSEAGAHSHGGATGSTAPTISSDASWRPPGYNFIVCEKD